MKPVPPQARVLDPSPGDTLHLPRRDARDPNANSHVLEAHFSLPRGYDSPQVGMYAHLIEPVIEHRHAAQRAVRNRPVHPARALERLQSEKICAPPKRGYSEGTKHSGSDGVSTRMAHPQHLVLIDKAVEDDYPGWLVGCWKRGVVSTTIRTTKDALAAVQGARAPLKSVNFGLPKRRFPGAR